MALPPHTFIRVFGKIIPIPVIPAAALRAAAFGILGPIAGLWATTLIPYAWVQVIINLALVYAIFRSIRSINRKLDRYIHDTRHGK